MKKPSYKMVFSFITVKIFLFSYLCISSIGKKNIFSIDKQIQIQTFENQ